MSLRDMMARYGPYLALFLPLGLFIGYPLFLVLKEGFLDGSGHLTMVHIGWALTDQRAVRVISFTVLMAAASAVITVVLTLPGAYLLAFHGKKRGDLVLAVTTVPFVLPPLVLAMGFIPLFGSSGYMNGALELIFGWVGAEPPHIKLLYTKVGILLAHIFLNFPIALRTLHQRMTVVGPGPVRASRSLGAGNVRTFLRVVLPEMKLSIAAALSLVFTFCLLSFGVVLVIGGLANATLEVEIYRLMVGHFDAHKAGALLLVELIFASMSAFLYLRLSGSSPPAALSDTVNTGHVIRLGWKGRLLSWTYVLLVSILILGPMVSVVSGSFSAGPGGTGPTLRWFERVVSRSSDPVIGSSPFGSIVNSLAIGALSTILAVSLGLAVSSLLDRDRFPGKGFLDAALLLPIGVSTVSLGFGLISAGASGPLDLRGSWAIVVLVHALISYPLAAMVLLSARRGVPSSMIRAARLLGDRWSALLLNIKVPLMVPGLLTAAVLCFAISIGEMGATMMVAPAELTTMPLALYRFISGGRDFGAASAYAVIMLVVTLGSFMVVHWVVRGLRRMGVGRSD